MSEPLIEVRGVRKTFEEGRIVAMRGMELEVAAGEFVAVVGPSGCGKSTLLHLIAALDEPDEGTIHVGGHALESRRDLDHYRARHVGMVFQLHNLLPTLTAAENVQMPMFELGLSARARRARAEHLLAAVGLEGRGRNRPPQLSGGERQRVALACALANEPPILLADEPTGSLDSAAGRNVLDLLESLQADHALTIVLVTHDREIAARVDRIVHMLDGRNVSGVTQPQPVESAAFGTESAVRSAGNPRARVGFGPDDTERAERSNDRRKEVEDVQDNRLGDRRIGSRG